jgi:uncharacterized protein YjbI with pentapeptide repeats
MPTLEWLEPGPAQATTLAYTLGPQRRLAVIVKLACSLEHGGPARLVAPSELVTRERHFEKDPARSVEAPSELSPIKPMAEVTLVGHAYAPAGRAVEAHAVRLAVFGPRGALVDRTLHVLGERSEGGRPRPFSRMPLVWERAVGGPGTDNPVGVAPGSGRAANVLDPHDATLPACFAPLSRYWPEAKRSLGAASRRAVDAREPALPEGFDGAYFQDAPASQRVPALAGDEWLVLDGLHPALPRLQTRLPGVLVSAMAYDGLGRAAPVALALDTVAIEVDRQLATLLFRGSLDVAAATALDDVTVMLSAGPPERRPRWPHPSTKLAAKAPREGATSSTPPSPAHAGSPDTEAESSLESTVFQPGIPSPVRTLPFRRGLALPRDKPPEPSLPREPAPPDPAHERREGPSSEGHDERDPLGSTTYASGPVAPALPFASGGPGAGGSSADGSHESTELGVKAPSLGLPFTSRPPSAGEPSRGAPPPPPSRPAAPPRAPTLEPRVDAPVDPLESMTMMGEVPSASPALPFGREAPRAPSHAPPYAAPPPAPPHAPPAPLAAPPSYVAPPSYPAPYAAQPPPSAPSWTPPAAPPAPPSAPQRTVSKEESDGEVTAFIALSSLGAALPFDPDAAPALSPSEGEPARREAPSWDIVDEGTIVSGEAPPPVTPWGGPAPAAPTPPARPPTPPGAPRARGRGPAPRPPRRRDGAVIPAVVRGPLTVATVAWQVKPPQDSLTVVVKGTFRMVPDGPAAPAAEPELCSGDVLASDDPLGALTQASDFAIFKPKADVLLVGHAYPPKSTGKPMTAAQVELRFGEGKRGFSRRIAVLGDRVWKRSLVVTGPGDPAPFERMPLTWDRAFGGAGYHKNPAGVGHESAAGEAALRLPNLEDPSSLVTSPSASPEPACPGPVATQWRERWSRLGTYDRAWFRTRWPYFPADFDYAFFQSAPRQQQLEHLSGDETFSLTGVHPEHPRLDGRLPGLRARCFVEPASAGDPPFREVRLALDTVVLDPDRMLLTLTWRGMLDVSEPEAPEVGVLFAMLEPLASKASSLDDARAAFLVAATPLDDAADEVPAAAPANDPPAASEPEPVDPERAALEKALDEREASIAAELEKAGLSTEPAATPPPPDPAALAASLAAAGLEPDEIAEVLETVSGPAGEPPPVTPPDPSAREKVAAAHARGEPLDGARLAGVDLSGLDLTGASLDGADLRGARLIGTKLDGARLVGALLCDAELSDASLRGAILMGADLTGATLSMTTLSGARLDAASFAEAKAERARFDGALGAKTSFVKAELAGATFEGAVLADADLTEATLDGARFDGATLEQVRLYSATGRRASFAGATLTGARADGVRLVESSFAGAKAKGAIFEKAELAGCTFLEAELAGASFAKAKAQGVVFSRADLREARLRRANLTGASFLKADLSSADLERAIMSQADLRGASLHEAELWHTKLDGAKLDHALVTQTKLVRKS